MVIVLIVVIQGFMIMQQKCALVLYIVAHFMLQVINLKFVFHHVIMLIMHHTLVKAQISLVQWSVLAVVQVHSNMFNYLVVSILV